MTFVFPQDRMIHHTHPIHPYIIGSPALEEGEMSNVRETTSNQNIQDISAVTQAFIQEQDWS